MIKQFKFACLTYAPTPVVFRNIEFNRAQMTIFRKFLMGQCSKIVHSSEPYKTLGSSTKMIFDDMYLFLKEAFLKSTGTRHLDEHNGMPKTENYAQIASDYWNNIYKDVKKENKMSKTLGGFFKS